jgi:hypothetical protein
MPSQNMQSRQELLNSLSNERINMITRGAEAKRLLTTFVYKGYDDAFIKGRLLETISKCEIRVKEIDAQLKELRKVEL